MDRKETTSSSIVVTRSKGGYQKNRLGTPVWFLYSHWSNQIVFTKFWNIRYHHLRSRMRPRMERLDTKSSMHHYLMLAMLQKMQSGHKGNYHFIHFSRTFERRIPKEPSWNPILFLYSHWSNQLVFTKSWYIWYNHLRPAMERLDSKSSTHTKQPFLAMLQKMESGHKGNYQFIHFSRTFERRIPKEPSWNAGLISLFTLVESAHVKKILIHLVPSFATLNGKVGQHEFNAH